jgi:hypothetical protein
MENSTIIEFEENGQDFTHWEVNKAGKITMSFPFQNEIWTQYSVLNIAELKKGDHPFMKQGNNKFLLRHKVIQITKNCDWKRYVAIQNLSNVRKKVFVKGGKNAN